MAVKASSNITLYHVIDVVSVTIYYLLQSSTANPPAKPTTDNPGGNWSTTEPTYTEGSTNTLYTVTKTKFSDGTFEYTPVSKSSSYEAAKQAYNIAYDTNQKMLAKESIIGTQTAATRFWEGVSNITNLTDGTEILYWLPYGSKAEAASSDKTVGGTKPMRVNSTTTEAVGTPISSFENSSQYMVWLNLTLKSRNKTGWIPCYYGGTSRLTTHYGAGNAIRLVYREDAKIGGEAATSQYTGWFADANYVDGNNTDRLRFQNNIKTNKQYVWANRVLVSDINGYFPLHSSVTFDRDKPILWAGSNLGPWINSGSNNNYISYPSWDMRYNAYQYFSSNAWNNGTVFDLINADIPSGKKIYSGTGITGTSTTATIFSGSGISSAAVDDRYINTSTGYYYKCTVAGAASAAKWVYEGDSRIPAGSRIYYGTHLTHTDGTSKNTATAITSAAVGDRYVNQNTGRLYECDTAGASGTAKWKDRGVWLQNNKTVYLICNQHGQYLTVDKDIFTTEPPNEENGKVYIAIGLSYAIYACGLFPEHPMFMYKDNAFKSLEQITYDSSEKAKEAHTIADNAKTRIDSFLDGDDDHSFSAYKRSVTSEINTETGKITNNFSTYMKQSSYGSTLDHATEFLEKVDSYITMSTNSQGQPYMELGVQPSASIPNTYRLRIENDEIYMVYGSGETEALTKLTSWSTKNGKSNFEVNTLVTQQEMAIEPFRFIKNDDGSLSFRKVE